MDGEAAPRRLALARGGDREGALLLREPAAVARETRVGGEGGAAEVANSKRAPPVSKAVFSRFYTAAHLSDGMSITLNVGAGVAASAGASASARSTARGARTVHCGAIRPAAPVKARANTILCILALLVRRRAGPNTTSALKIIKMPYALD